MSRRSTTGSRLIAHASCLLALLVAATPCAWGQGKDMGQAAQYYKQTPAKKKFKIVQPKTGTKSDIKFTIPPGGHPHYEKDEYAILEPDVTVEYQDVKIHADKITVNFKNKDVVAQGDGILDQGPHRM